MVDFEKVRKYDAAALRDEADRISRKLAVFLAGPFINELLPQTDKVNSETSAKRLRFHLLAALTHSGHTVYLGEDTKMRANGVAQFGPLGNAVVYERHHITKNVDALLVLPDSPGSFCEVGDWVTDKRFCAKMMLVVDKQYEGELNFVNEGVVRLAQAYHARVEYLDYEDLGAVQSKCEEFLTSIAQDLEVEALFGRK
ncbi:MAG TPA: hypothetical protein DIT67_12945 [Octadecabacter sp.]|nr:hypothetical protein [Octadecabacter sp.]